MSIVVDRGPEWTAVLELAGTSGVPVGDGVAPDEGGWPGEDTSDLSAYVPYAVVHGGPTSDQDGTVTDPDVDTGSEYLVTSVGVSAGQARWVAGKVGAALLSGGLVVPGRDVQSVRLEGGATHSGRDDDTTPSTHFLVETYVVRTSPL